MSTPQQRPEHPEQQEWTATTPVTGEQHAASGQNPAFEQRPANGESTGSWAPPQQVVPPTWAQQTSQSWAQQEQPAARATVNPWVIVGWIYAGVSALVGLIMVLTLDLDGSSYGFDANGLIAQAAIGGTLLTTGLIAIAVNLAAMAVTYSQRRR